MFDFVLHLHCNILFILQFSMFCIFFWCSQSFLSAFFRSNPEQHDQYPSLVQMIPKLDGTSTCLECQDMPPVTEAKIHLLNHVFLVKNVEKNCCSTSPTCICIYLTPLPASLNFCPVLPPPPLSQLEAVKWQNHRWNRGFSTHMACFSGGDHLAWSCQQKTGYHNLFLSIYVFFQNSIFWTLRLKNDMKNGWWTM